MVALPKDETPKASPVHNKAPVKYFGGKQSLVPTLLSLVPPHDTYIEVFGGAGSLLFSKYPSPLEVYNDINSGLVNFFRVLRDPQQCKELQRLLNLTPYSREEYLDCRSSWRNITDPVEKARRWYVNVQMCFAGFVGRTGWSNCLTSNGHAPRKFRNNTEALTHFSRRLLNVQIENQDFATIFKTYDNANAFFYCDPPYLPETRRDGSYPDETTEADHIHLLELATSCKGKVIISGYDSPLYRDMLTGWRLVTFQTVAQSAAHTEVNGLKGKGVMKVKQARTECIWLKPNTIQQASLWEGL